MAQTHHAPACTCLAVRELHGALCCLSHVACRTVHDKAGLLRRVVRCAPHGASAARAAHEPPSSEPANAHAVPHIRGVAFLGSSHPAWRERGLNGGSCRVHGGCSSPRRVRHASGTSAYRTVAAAMPSRLVAPAPPYTADALQQVRRAARGRTRCARRPKVRRLPDLGRWRTGGGHRGRWSGVEQTKRQAE